jgi:molybdopterin adenylyltransferase
MQSMNTTIMPGVVMDGGSEESIGDAAQFGIITVSDRASSGVYQDLSGPAILQFFHEAVQSRWSAHYRLVPDEKKEIEATIIDLVDNVGCR